MESGDGESEINSKRAQIIETDKEIIEERKDQRNNHSPPVEIQSETPNLENPEKSPPRFTNNSSMSSSDSDSDLSESSSDDLIPKWSKIYKKYIDNLSVLKNGLTYQIKILLAMNHIGTETLYISGRFLITNLLQDGT